MIGSWVLWGLEILCRLSHAVPVLKLQCSIVLCLAGLHDPRLPRITHHPSGVTTAQRGCLHAS
jgi:hypothetical protein